MVVVEQKDGGANPTQTDLGLLSEVVRGAVSRFARPNSWLE
jgi:hypothetical protein